MGLSVAAIHSSLNMNAREAIKHQFIATDNLDVLVLSYITSSNEGLNLHYRCHHNIMIEQGLNYSQEHQAWSRIRRIGQTHVQYTEHLVNLDTVDVMIEASQ